MAKKSDIQRGDIVIVDLNPTRGAEESKIRPCVIIQNDIGNKYSPVTIIACITTGDKAIFDTEVEVKAPEGGLKNNSLILLNQIRTIDKTRIIDCWGTLKPETIEKINEALKVSLALIDI
jgi:mRNA interferase MazF